MSNGKYDLKKELKKKGWAIATTSDVNNLINNDPKFYLVHYEIRPSKKFPGMYIVSVLKTTPKGAEQSKEGGDHADN